MGQIGRLIAAALAVFSGFCGPALAQIPPQGGAVSQMQSASTPYDGTERLYLSQEGQPRKTTMGDLGRFIASQAAPGFRPEQFGAQGNGTGDDGPAIQAACAKGEVQLWQQYRVASNLSLSCDLLFGPGAELIPDSGKTITITGAIIAGPTQWIFHGDGSVIASTASWVSVAWWGALANATTDGMPGIRAALGSNRTIFFPPASYACSNADVTASPYPLIVSIQCILVDHLSNIRIEGYGAEINLRMAANGSSPLCCVGFIFNHVDNLEVEGLSLRYNTNGLANKQLTGSFNSGALVIQTTNAAFRHIRFTGNWGGSTREALGFGLTWVTNAVFDDIEYPTGSLCFDTGQMRNVTIQNVWAVGGDDDGTTNAPANIACFNLETDHNFPAAYPAENTFSTSENITLGPGLHFSNFTTAVFLRAGFKVNIVGNVFDLNPGSSSSILPAPGGNGFGNVPGMGVYVHYDTNACCSSVGTPPGDITISGTVFRSNGATVQGCAVLADSNLSGGESVGPVALSGNIFDQNNNCGFGSFTNTNFLGYSAGGNAFVAGAAQTIPIEANALAWLGSPR